MHFSGIEAYYKATTFVLPGIKPAIKLAELGGTVGLKVVDLLFYPPIPWLRNIKKQSELQIELSKSVLIVPVPSPKMLPFQGNSSKIQTNKKTTATPAIAPKITQLNISSKSASKKPAAELNQKYLTLPKPDSPYFPKKTFLIAKTYKADESGVVDWTQVDYLTHVELFNMLIHKELGNFSPAIAAIFVAIAAYEMGNIDLYTGGKIPIAIANGSEHLGFFQLRCKPENTTITDNWLVDTMAWNAPYFVQNNKVYLKEGILIPKKYAWESFLGIRKSIWAKFGGLDTTEDFVKKIMENAKKAKPAKDKDVAVNLIKALQPRHPAEHGTPYDPKKHSARRYGGADATEASSHLADFAKIAANQIWMMKSKFNIGPDSCNGLPLNKNGKIQAIVAPFQQQKILINNPSEMTKKQISIFEPWDDQTFGQASTYVAYNVLNKALNYDYDEAKSELNQLLGYKAKFSSSVDFDMLKKFINLSSNDKGRIYRFNIIN